MMYLLLFVYLQSKIIKFQFKTKYTTVINTSSKINKFVCESISLAKLKWTDYRYLDTYQISFIKNLLACVLCNIGNLKIFNSVWALA